MRSLSRNALKYIAITAMLLDHIAFAFLPVISMEHFIMRLLGRLTAPIMCFFIAEGFHYTRSKYRYGLRLGVFALISQAAFTYFSNGTFFSYEAVIYWNVLFTLFIGFVVIVTYDKISNKPIKWLAIGALWVVSIIGDWGITAPAWILCFHVYRDSRKAKFIAFGIIAAVVAYMNIIDYGFWNAGVFLAIPLLLRYNGEKGHGNDVHKWAFYLFYPLHLFALGIIKWLPVG